MIYLAVIILFIVALLGAVLRIMYIRGAKEAEQAIKKISESDIRWANDLINHCLNQIESE